MQRNSQETVIQISNTIRLWLSHALECRMTNHGAHGGPTFNTGVSYFWSRQAITVVVLSKMWLNVVPGAFVTHTRFPERLEGDVRFSFPKTEVKS